MYEHLWREVWELPAASDIGKFPSEEYPGERYPLPVPVEKNLTSVEVLEIPALYQGHGFYVEVISGTTPSR